MSISTKYIEYPGLVLKIKEMFNIEGFMLIPSLIKGFTVWFWLNFILFILLKYCILSISFVHIVNIIPVL